MSDGLKKIAVFFGGQSVEHDVSVLSGLQFIEALDPELYAALPVYIDERGRWWTGDALSKRSFYPLSAAGEAVLTPVNLAIGTDHLAGPKLNVKAKGLFGGKSDALSFDLAVSAVHGTGGEDGALQGLFEFAGIPYAGCPVLASAAAMDKVFTKRVLGALGVPVLAGAVIERPASGVHLDADALAEEVADNMAHGFPYCVKPRNLGSSIGVARAADKGELLATLLNIFRMDQAALVEPFVPNLVEYNIAVAKIGGEVRTSAIERPLNDETLLDFSSKYLAGGSGGPKLDEVPSEGMVSQNRALNPEELTDTLEKLIRDSALQAFEALQLAGSVRVDFLSDSNSGEIWLNEINTIPGSFAYYLWQAASPPLSFSALTSAMIAEGFRFHQGRSGESGAKAGGGAIFQRA